MVSSHSPTLDKIRAVAEREVGNRDAAVMFSYGFISAIAFAMADPVLASAINSQLKLEWSLDASNPADYGALDTAKRFLEALGQKQRENGLF